MRADFFRGIGMAPVIGVRPQFPNLFPDKKLVEWKFSPPPSDQEIFSISYCFYSRSSRYRDFRR